MNGHTQPVRVDAQLGEPLSRWLWLVKWILLIPHGIVLGFLWLAVYGYGALATDRYLPFTLKDVEDYPARLRVEYPERLSRGLVLVKWWLLVIPHLLVLALFSGAAISGTWGETAWYWQSPGLADLLVLIAALALLFTGRYPRGIFEFVMGINRWVLRVAACVLLLADRYPPFRLDMGGLEPVPGDGRERERNPSRTP